ncbi:MAG: superoxide dismutase [Myxococcales bacterium]
MADPTALAGNHQLQPLPFDPAKLKGLSERLIVSHHENNYGGAVRNLNRTEQELARVTKDTPPLLVAALKERELTFANSATLHELYFGNLAGDGRAGGGIERAVARAYGSFGRWEELFRLTGLGLAGGSGWVILAYDFQRNDVRTFWSGNHAQACVYARPLLVLDMYEHAYALDYGAAAAKYVDAFFENVNWEEVDRRLERVENVAADPRG